MLDEHIVNLKANNLAGKNKRKCLNLLPSQSKGKYD
jgi:hypothetical protein